MSNGYDFSDIAPFDDSQFKEKMAQLVKEPGFEHAVKYVMPEVDFSQFVRNLLAVPDKETFQKQVMRPFIEMLMRKTTNGITFGGIENIVPGVSNTYITNHRDIVLDASFLNYCLLKNDIRTSEVAIGNNLLIYEWITDLVKLNKSFIVKRNLRLTQALEAAKQLSAYIHYAINTKHESVWIAQREGRAKDSNDVTQESLVKMLGLNGGGTVALNVMEINLLPVSISYEYDPNDYLKAREFLLKRLDPEFKKCQHDDLLSMETGLLGHKGRVHFQFSPCLNSRLEPLESSTDKIDTVKQICSMVDNAIHSGYKIFPVNYIAHDLLHHSQEYEAMYTAEEKSAFEVYVNTQLDKVKLPDISTLDREFMHEMMLQMYANPLRNKLQATGKKPVQ